MKLPYGDEAVVPTKITEYLLNEAHPQGRAKARFFQRLGFRREQPDVLRRAPIELAQTNDMTEIVFKNAYQQPRAPHPDDRDVGSRLLIGVLKYFEKFRKPIKTRTGFGLTDIAVRVLTGFLNSG